jgi:hypothetical protein
MYPVPEHRGDTGTAAAPGVSRKPQDHEVVIRPLAPDEGGNVYDAIGCWMEAAVVLRCLPLSERLN